MGEEGAQHVEEALKSDTAAAFEAAAIRLKAQREVEQMPIEDKIAKWFKQWSAEWQVDMDACSEEVKDSSSGYVGTVQSEQTMAFYKALYKQLKHRQVGFKGGHLPKAVPFERRGADHCVPRITLVPAVACMAPFLHVLYKQPRSASKFCSCVVGQLIRRGVVQTIATG